MKFEFSPYIAVQVQDSAKAVDFYKRVLGMEILDSKGTDTYMDKDGINFVIEDNSEGAGSVFFEFKTDNLAEAKQALENEGCTIMQVFGEHSIMFCDPYGMNFHVWEDGAFPVNPVKVIC